MFRNYRVCVGGFVFYKRLDWQAAAVYRKRMKEIYRAGQFFRMDHIQI